MPTTASFKRRFWPLTTSAAPCEASAASSPHSASASAARRSLSRRSLSGLKKAATWPPLETTLVPALETTLVPALETTLVPALETTLVPALETTLVPAQDEDALELDELWSFVHQRKRKRWVWLAQCRRTRQIVAYAIGGRGQKTCRLLWRRIPKAYKKSLLYTDFWKAFCTRTSGKPMAECCLPPSIAPQERATGRHVTPIKPHIERFNNVLRQRLARFVRKTLSFSKCDLFQV